LGFHQLMEFGLKEYLIRQLCLVLGDQCWSVCAVESILDNLVIFAGTSQNVDGGLFKPGLVLDSAEVKMAMNCT